MFDATDPGLLCIIMQWRDVQWDPEVESLQINSTPDALHPLESDTNPAEMNKSSWHSNHKGPDWSVISFDVISYFDTQLLKLRRAADSSRTNTPKADKIKNDITKSSCSPRIRRKHFCGLQKCTLPTFLLPSVSERPIRNHRIWVTQRRNTLSSSTQRQQEASETSNILFICLHTHTHTQMNQ